jgi:hypothetical protein
MVKERVNEMGVYPGNNYGTTQQKIEDRNV